MQPYIIEMFSMNNKEKSTLRVCSYWPLLKTLTMFHTKTFLFDHIYLSMLAKQTCFCYNLLWPEYNAAANLNIRINIKLNSSFSHSWKTMSLLAYAIPCHTHAGVDFEVIQGWICYSGTHVPMILPRLGIVKPKQT